MYLLVRVEHSHVQGCSSPGLRDLHEGMQHITRQDRMHVRATMVTRVHRIWLLVQILLRVLGLGVEKRKYEVIREEKIRGYKRRCYEEVRREEVTLVLKLLTFSITPKTLTSSGWIRGKCSGSFIGSTGSPSVLHIFVKAENLKLSNVYAWA